MSFEDYVQSAFFTRVSNFQYMRSALREFLAEHRLSTKIVDIENVWRGFLFLFCGIISEVPLVYRGVAKSNETIRELTLTREEGKSRNEFRLQWEATLFSGQVLGVVSDCPETDIEYDWWSGKPLGWDCDFESE